MEIYQDDWLILFACWDTAVAPILGRRVARRENKFEIFAVGDFTVIQRRSSEEIYREKEGPEVTQPAQAFWLRTLHHYAMFRIKGRPAGRPYGYSVFFAFSPANLRLLIVLICALCALCG